MGLMEGALAQGKYTDSVRPACSLTSASLYEFTGWIVTLPDHEGPNSTFTAGPAEGMAMLDAIRATLLFGPTVGLVPYSRTVLWGYSGLSRISGS